MCEGVVIDLTKIDKIEINVEEKIATVRELFFLCPPENLKNRQKCGLLQEKLRCKIYGNLIQMILVQS